MKMPSNAPSVGLHVVAGLMVLALFSADLAAQDPRPERRRGGRRRQQTTQPTTTQSQPSTTTAAADATRPGEAASTTTAAAEEKKDRYFAVINGVVHTVTGPVLDNADVLCKNGKIQAIGSDLALPPDTEVVDAAGKYVYPGLVVAAPASTLHGNEPPEDTTDVFGLSMNIALAGGITTAVSGNTAAKLTFGTVEDMVIRRNLYVNLTYSTRTPDQRRELRADLDRVRQYLRELAQHELDKEAGKETKEPAKDWIRDKFERYLKLLKREAIAVATANTRGELVDYCDLARTYGIRLVLRGAYEGWTIPDVMGRSAMAAVVTPRRWVPPDERFNRPTGSTIETAQVLHTHGLTVAVVPDTVAITTWGVGGRDLLHLNMEAAFAVRGGMSNDDAVKAITINAARVLGIDDRIGSLESGKDADLVVCSGDILNFMTQVHYTIVNGRVAYDKAKDPLYEHIRPAGQEAEPPPPGDAWPKKLEWPADFVFSPHPGKRETTTAPATTTPATNTQPATDESSADSP